MPKKWTMLALMFSVLVNVAAMGTIGYYGWRARSAGRPLPPPPPPESLLRPLRGPLSLSPAQMQELEAQRRWISEEIRGIRRDLSEKRARLMQLLRSPDPDSTAVEEILQEIASYQVTLERKIVQSILQMRKVLTPEQREKLFRMIERRGGWRGWDRMGPRLDHGKRNRLFRGIPGRRYNGPKSMGPNNNAKKEGR